MKQGQRLRDRYRIVQPLGSGGFGAVYLATDEQFLSRQVVVKIPHAQLLVDEEFRARFEREIESLLRLQHPHIVKVLDGGVSDGTPFAVMEYLSGGNLLRRLGRSGAKESPQKALEWLEPIAEALDSVHARGILHRDVKPENILFDEAGNAFLADFGIAKAIEGPALTLNGIPGSPSYMGPEALDPKTVGPAYDQYALGVALFRALSGEFPFERVEGIHPGVLIIQKSERPPRDLGPLVPGLPAAAAKVVMRSLSLRPEDRFPTCGTMVRAFEAALTAEPRHAGTMFHAPTGLTPAAATPGTAPASQPPAAARGARVSPRAVALICALALVVAGGVYWLALAPRQKMPVQTGVLTVSSVPSQAQLVAIDQDARETRASTPARLTLEVGDYDLAVSRTGYATARQTVRVLAGKDAAVELYLEPLAEPAAPKAPAEVVPRRSETVRLFGGAELELVWVPGGTAFLGCSEEKWDCAVDELPRREASVQGFWLGRTEVTQRQWKSVTHQNPSRYPECGEDCPVENVSWAEVQGFLLIAGTGLRLPTDEEWEFAALGGGTADPYGEIDAIAWHARNSGRGRSQEVARKLPNGYGLYDMLGGVGEWVQAPGVVRGGSRYDEPELMGVAARYRYETTKEKDEFSGLRLARSAVPRPLEP